MIFLTEPSAFRLSLVFFLLFVFAPYAVAQSDCPGRQFAEISKVRYVYDGDTLQLNDGRKIRLIGINAPELKSDGKPAQAYANEAKKALTSLFNKDKSIALVYGKDKKDRYGRLLAHVFLADGQNVQALLLKQGFANAITIPPNTQFASCYLEMESFARCSMNGLWKNTNILDAKSLEHQHSGFHLIMGRLENINTSNNGIWLDIDNRLTIGIRPDDQPRFDMKRLNTMLNQAVIVRGWLSESNRSTPFYLRLRHPLSLQLLSTYSCAEN
jgi:endonuclease YncB( thermonuclease family)